MNTKLSVKLKSDTNFVPIKYDVVEMSVGTATSDTYCVLIVNSVGWDTEENYELWTDRRDATGMVGKLGDLSIESLSDIEVYNVRTPSRDM
jgi:hypothetical protein